MYQNYITKYVSLVSICLIVFCLNKTAGAAYKKGDELKLLRLYYDEKELVEAPTRHPKYISYVAENVTVVTSKEIETCHSVAEALRQIAGIFVESNQDFGANSLIQSQGSEERHVLVLLDGIPWNLMSSGAAETNSIPVGIIKRIEVIKGPGSSAWGSALGGVVDIITKIPGKYEPEFSIRASYGERNTQDYRAELSGKAGLLEYYTYVGRQDSDGLRDSRYFENDSFYSKFQVTFSRDLKAGLTMGYSQPHINAGDFASAGVTQRINNRNFFTTASLDAYLTDELSTNLSLWKFRQKSVMMFNALGPGIYGHSGELISDTVYDEETTGVTVKLVWEHGIHDALVGAEFERGSLDHTFIAGPSAVSDTHPDMKKWAIFANDTVVIDRLSVTPGIRYDYNSISGSFVSPSLGTTYRYGRNTILRASVARGFTSPPFSLTSVKGLSLEPNPDLKAEEVWSYQAGIESGIEELYVWLKATVFHHDLRNEFIRSLYATGSSDKIYVNSGKVRRTGFEIEIETVPVYNLCFRTGFSFVDISPPNFEGSSEQYSYNIDIIYDDRKSFRVRLFGLCTWWDINPSAKGEYDDFIWELDFSKKIYSVEKVSADIFLKAHNLFNGSQYTYGDNTNPERWIEFGITVDF